MNVSQALKLKNRLAGELVRQQQIFQRENARRNDSVSKVNRIGVWGNILKLSDDLGKLKGKIALANVGIYSSLERMAELKSRIGFLSSLDKREGPEVVSFGGDREPKTYQWDSFINQEKCDSLISDIQKEIDALQDNVDAYNASTQIAED
jgi:hypothetical protein